MSRLPRATVLMPMYNAGEFVAEAIESILNQTYSDFKLLVIDDGSSDNSVQVVQSFQDERIQLCRNDENMGLVDTLNRGLRMIDTEYILRMDADDISLPTRFEEQIQFMDNNPLIGVSSFQTQLIGNENKIATQPLNDQEMKAQVFFRTVFNHGGVIYRSKVLLENELFYRSIYPHFEDHDMWYRLMKYTSFGNIDKVLYLYRRGTHNVTVRNKSTKTQRLKAFYKDMLADLEIEATETDLLYCLPLGSWDANKRNIKGYKAFLLRLKQQNEVVKIFPGAAFEKVLKDKWEKAFYKMPENGLGSVFWYAWYAKGLNFRQLKYTFKFYGNKLMPKRKK